MPMLKSCAAALGLLVLAGSMQARAEGGGRDRGWILEFGPAAEWPTSGDTPNYGGNVAVEKEVIERWLELELGMTALGTSGQGELSWDLLFKKPFTLSPTVEMMVGAGPELTKPLNGGWGRFSLEFAVDFMVWSADRAGWFVEPTFSVNPGTGETAFGATGGILLSF